MNKFCNKNNVFREVYFEITNSRITHVSDNCCHILGYSSAEIINKDIKEYIEINKKNDLHNEFDIEFTNKDGQERWLNIRAEKKVDTNGVSKIIATAIDITKYYDVNKENQSIIEIINRSKGLIYRYELYPQRRFTYVTPYTNEIGGYTVEEVLNDKDFPQSILHYDDKEIFDKKLNGTADYTKPFQTRYLNKAGQYIWLEEYVTPIYDAAGKLIALESTCRDITKLKSMEEKLTLLSYTDCLTGMNNKAYLKEYLNDIVNKNISIGVIYCDLDNLKITNDKLGHDKGDELIVNSSGILKNIFKGKAAAIRCGGDEFLIIIENISQIDFENYCNTVRREIEKYNKTNIELPIEMSIGISYSEEVNNDIQDIINAADKDMYRNKKKNKKIAAL